MRRASSLALKVLCLVLAALLAYEGFVAIRDRGAATTLGLAALGAPGKAPPSVSAGGEHGAASTEVAKGAIEVPPLAERFQPIVASGVFGQMPVNIPMPALVGIIGNSAILRLPDGNVGTVPEGGELGGVKVLRIGVNRVLIEYLEKRNELQVFEGIGGDSLLEKPEGK